MRGPVGVPGSRSSRRSTTSSRTSRTSSTRSSVSLRPPRARGHRDRRRLHRRLSGLLEQWRDRSRLPITVSTRRTPGRAARNGASSRERQWVTFTDPDDTLDRRFFEAADRFARAHPEVELMAPRVLLRRGAQRPPERHPRRSVLTRRPGDGSQREANVFTGSTASPVPARPLSGLGSIRRPDQAGVRGRPLRCASCWPCQHRIGSSAALGTIYRSARRPPRRADRVVSTRAATRTSSTRLPRPVRRGRVETAACPNGSNRSSSTSCRGTSRRTMRRRRASSSRPTWRRRSAAATGRGCWTPSIRP